MTLAPDAFIPIEDVFKTSGIPTYTFVEPFEYDRIRVFLRTQSKPLIVEGPSGIGKTTTVVRALHDLDLYKSVSILRARVPAEAEMIEALPEIFDSGCVLIDDFHVLKNDVKSKIANFIKVMIDEDRRDAKIIILGINEAGQTLIEFARDLTGRVDKLRFENNSAEKLEELITKGEHTLNIRIANKRAIAEESVGSFQLCQMLAQQACINAGITQSGSELRQFEAPIESIRGQILDNVSPGWAKIAYKFARGSKFRPSGRAPYLRLLYWISKSGQWSLDVRKALNENPSDRLSVSQIIDKEWLSKFLQDNPDDLGKFIHFDEISQTLSIEDPKAFYYLRHLSWPKFVRQCGFVRLEFKSKYDFAISFAGADRDVAEALSLALKEHDLQIFYDFDQAHEIAGADLEKYLAPIYGSESEFILALISGSYPTRVWAKFESEQFRVRFGEDRVIPVFLDGTQPTFFDELFKRGGFSIRRSDDVGRQCAGIAETLAKKIASLSEQRESDAADEEDGAEH